MDDNDFFVVSVVVCEGLYVFFSADSLQLSISYVI